MGKSFVVELQKHFLISDRRDGILEAFNLDLPEFHPVYIENKRVILIEVRQPNTQELLRFIRFQSNKDGYCVGGLLMANFKQLSNTEIWALAERLRRQTKGRLDNTATA